MKMVAALLVSAMLVGCQSADAPRPVEDPRQVWCDSNSPRSFSDDQIDAMSEAQARRELEYQRQGESWCGWEV